jgi:hypothetical protein
MEEVNLRPVDFVMPEERHELEDGEPRASSCLEEEHGSPYLELSPAFDKLHFLMKKIYKKV